MADPSGRRACLLGLSFFALVVLASPTETSEENIVESSSELQGFEDETCEMGQGEEICSNGLDANGVETEEYTIDIEALKRRSSKGRGRFVYDLEDVLSDETIEQLVNVSSKKKKLFDVFE